MEVGAKGSVDTCHASDELGKVGHDIATLGNSAAGTGTTLSVAHHAIVALGGIVNPGIEVAQHTGVDSGKEIEEVFREVKVTGIALCLVPVDEILCHPDFFTFLGQILISRLDTTILVTAIDVEAFQHVSLVQGVGIGVAHSQCFRRHHLTTDALAVGFYKLGNFRSVPQTAGILRRPVRLVLDGDGIKFYTIIAQVLHIVFQILRIVRPVLTFQLARGAVFVLGVDGAVGFPFGRLPPW